MYDENMNKVHTFAKNHEVNIDIVINIEKNIKNIDISPNIRGYYYLQIMMIFKIINKRDIFKDEKNLYLTIAKIFETTPMRVERSIKHAIYILIG